MGYVQNTSSIALYVSLCIDLAEELSSWVVDLAENVKETAERIRRLQVQGARNVAIAAVEALERMASQLQVKDRRAFIRELVSAKEILSGTRPTEPLMRNAIKWVISSVQDSPRNEVKALAGIVSSSACEFLTALERSRECIAKIGAKRIGDGTVVFTHCHSSTVTHMLKEAKKDGRKFEVICTETRPLFQGRITAQEMLKLGVEVTLIVDSAARCFMKRADMTFVGADAISAEGNVVNKIGTAAIALEAQEARVPFYVVSELLKFDPMTLCGEYEGIEERSGDEVWKEAPGKLIVRNPAFEVVRRDFIHGIVCEEGIIPPHSVTETMHRKYPWVFS